MGGMQKHSRLLAEYVAQTGQSVVLYHYVPSDSELPTETEVRSHFSNEANHHLEVRTFRYPAEDRLPGHYLRAQKRISRIYADQLKSERFTPRLVYSKGFMSWDLVKRRKEFDSGMILAVKFHGMNMFQQQPDWKGEIVKYLLRPPVRDIMNASDYVFSYGGKITDIIRRELKDPDKVVELPSGIDSHWLAKSVQSNDRVSGEETSCLFVGRWDRLKGLPELYKVLRKRKDLRLTMTFVGPIPEEYRMDDPRVHYTGPIHDAKELQAIYDRHDLLLCPSISEGMPNVIMEAMSRGLAVIATDLGATAALVNERTGWLIPAKDTIELEKAIERALNKVSVRSKGDAGRELIENEFNWSVIAERFLNWYNFHCNR